MSKIYETFEKSISSLITDISEWEIGLPDLQRPYIRERSRVRDLFDSLYTWYPTWLILLLENETSTKIKQIWVDEKIQKIPRYVVIDGQQRLTSLYAVITWFPVIKNNWNQEIIKISFNPIEEKFEVANPITQKSNEWIHDIKEVFDWDSYFFTKKYLEENSEKINEDSDLANKIPERINTLKNILGWKFTCIWISKAVRLDQVSEIFLRINSQWKKLNNADFILTLMSVYRDQWRKDIEEFSLYTKNQNDILSLEADEIVRLLMGVWLYRAKLEDAYKFLKNSWEEFPDLSKDLEHIINKNNRKNYLSIIKWMWFIDKSLLTQYSLIFACYIFYIIGVERFKISFPRILKIIQKYYIRTYLWWKYASWGETILEKDLKTIQKLLTGDSYIEYLDEEANAYLNDDARNIQLPRSIITSSPLNSIFIAYTASQIYYNKKILFKDTTLTSYFLSKSNSDDKIEIDHHHIFPRQYLIERYGMENIDTKQINQIANKVYCYNVDNKIIGSKSPIEYVANYKNEYWEYKINKSLKENNIHERFYEMDYETFLIDRREKILWELKKFVTEISDPTLIQIDNADHGKLMSQWESQKIEFKSTFRRSLTENKVADYIKYQVIKTISAFLNTWWWTLFIWVNDAWDILWLNNDINSYQNKSLDSLLKDIDNMLKDNFSKQYANIKVLTIQEKDQTICIIEVLQATTPTYLQINGKDEFYIRRSASSIALTLSEASDYISDHFTRN